MRYRQPLPFEVWSSAKGQNAYSLLAAFAVEADAAYYVEHMKKAEPDWHVFVEHADMTKSQLP